MNKLSENAASVLSRKIEASVPGSDLTELPSQCWFVLAPAVQRRAGFALSKHSLE